VEVLTGAETEGVHKWQHDKVSTYGIGTEHSRPEWKVVGRELIRLGYVRQDPAKFNVLSLTAAGVEALKKRTPIRLTRAVQAMAPRAHRAGAIACDEVLFERLQQWRAQSAAERGVHPHTLFSDVTLRLMARDYPATEADLAGISGMSDKKLREFGASFLAEIAAHLQKHARQVFADTAFQVVKGEDPTSAAGRRNRGPRAEGEADYDRELFEKLRRVRLGLAQARGVPAYVILHDSVLRELARSQPASEEALADVKQVGPNRARQFGQAFIEAIDRHLGRGE